MARIWGKVVGGALGFVLGGGPFGAALGAMAGHAYDKGEEVLGEWQQQLGNGNAQASREETSRSYTQAVVALGAKLAKADGPVTRPEIDAFKRVFKITPQQEDGISQLFDRARRNADGYEPYAFKLAQQFRNQPAVLENVLYGLFVIAASDNPLINQSEARFLKTIAFIFNFTPDQLTQISNRAQVRLPPPANDGGGFVPNVTPITSSLAVLGLTEKATNAEIKVTYRKLIRENHPDKLASEGKPPTFIAAANEKMKSINAAYDEVSRLRGIK